MRRLLRASNHSSWVRLTRHVTVPTLFALVLAFAAMVITHHHAAAQLAPNASACTARAWGSPLCQWASRGETVPVRTVIAWSCPDRTQPYDLAVVADAPLLAGDEALMARHDVVSLVQRMDLPSNDLVRLGFVAYGDSARPMTSLGASAADHVASVQALAEPQPGMPSGSGGLAAGMREGLKMLAIGKRPPPSGDTQDPAKQGMVVLASPRGEDYCHGFGEEWHRSIEDGVDVTIICMNGDCEPSCLDQYGVRTLSGYAWDIMALEQEKFAWRSRLRVEFFDLSETVHEKLSIIAGSIDSKDGSHTVNGQLIRWKLDVRRNDDQRMLLAYSVQPQEAGRFDVRRSRSSFGHLRDTRGRTAKFHLPPLDIMVPKGRVFRSYLPWLDRVAVAPLPTPDDKTFHP